MPACKVCAHPARPEIDRLLIAAQPYRSVAQQYEVSPDSVYRHQQNHLPTALVQASEAQAVVDADDLLGQVKDLREKASQVLTEALEIGTPIVALGAIREARNCIELMTKMILVMQQQDAAKPSRSELWRDPEWCHMREFIANLLTPEQKEQFLDECRRMEAAGELPDPQQPIATLSQ